MRKTRLRESSDSGVRIKLDQPLKSSLTGSSVLVDAQVEIDQQIQPVRNFLLRYSRRGEKALHFLSGQVHPAIVFGVNRGELLTRLDIVRKSAEMLDETTGRRPRIFRNRPRVGDLAL